MRNFQTLFINIPELIKVSTRGKGNIGKVDTDYATVKAAPVFWLSIVILSSCNIVEAVS